MFTHIVVPLDGSSESNVAVAQACLLAHVTGAHVTLLHVQSGTEVSPETRAVLDQAALECNTASVPTEVVTRSGDAADVILQQVDERKADLVVMRTRGRSGIGRAVLGSVAETIVKRSPTPVVLLAAGTRSADAVRTILVPVDGSPGGALALGAARELASLTRAQLRLLQVVVPAPMYLSASFAVHGPIYIDPAWDVDAEAGARAYVNALTTRLSRGGNVAEGEVLMGRSVPDAIVRNATEHQADLIVMSTEAHTGVARAVFGSVTDAVVRTAGCPVLVLRRVPEDDPASAVDGAR